MLLVELALQGVRGFSPRARIAFRPGLNVARIQEPSRRRALVDLIYHSLYPDPSRSNATASLAESDSKDSRVALTFLGRDRATYRIIRDVATGAVSLQKLQKASKEFALLTQTSQEVAQYIRVQERLPNEVDYERLFLFSPDAMPSKGIRAKTRSGAAIAAGASLAPSLQARASRTVRAENASWASGSGPQAVTPPAPGGIGSTMNLTNVLVKSEIETAMDPSALALEDGEASDVLVEKTSRIRKLREEAEQVGRSERAQADLDRLHARRLELMKGLERIGALKKEVENLRKESAEESDLRELPAGFGERLRNYEEAEAKHSSDRQKLALERAEIEDLLRESAVPALARDRYFVAGILFAALFVLLSVIWEKPSLALMNVLALAVAAGAAFRWVGDLERRARIELRLSAMDEREQRLERQFDLDTAVMRRLMQKRTVADPGQLLERIEAAAKLERQLRVAEDALAAELKDPALRDADREFNEVNRRIEVCEAEVLSTQGVDSFETIKRRISQLQREVAHIEAKKRRDREPSSEDDEEGYGSGYGSSAAMRRPSSNDPDKGAQGGPPGEREPWSLSAAGFGGGGGSGAGRGGARGDYEADDLSTRPDRSRDLVQAVVDLLQIPVDDVPGRLGEGLGDLLSALTDGAFNGLLFGARGEVSVTSKKGEDSVAYVDLGAPQIDLVDSALRLSLVEACVDTVKVPILVDDPHPNFSPEKRALFAEALTRLGGGTQLLLLTERDDVAGHILTW